MPSAKRQQTARDPWRVGTCRVQAQQGPCSLRVQGRQGRSAWDQMIAQEAGGPEWRRAQGRAQAGRAFQRRWPAAESSNMTKCSFSGETLSSSGRFNISGNTAAKVTNAISASTGLLRTLCTCTPPCTHLLEINKTEKFSPENNFFRRQATL